MVNAATVPYPTFAADGAARARAAMHINWFTKEGASSLGIVRYAERRLFEKNWEVRETRMIGFPEAAWAAE